MLQFRLFLFSSLPGRNCISWLLSYVDVSSTLIRENFRDVLVEASPTDYGRGNLRSILFLCTYSFQISQNFRLWSNLFDPSSECGYKVTFIQAIKLMYIHNVHMGLKITRCFWMYLTISTNKNSKAFGKCLVANNSYLFERNLLIQSSRIRYTRLNQSTNLFKKLWKLNTTM